MHPLGVGVAGWRQRRLLTRVIVAALALVVGLPVLLVGLAVGASGGRWATITSPAEAVPPLGSWTVTQEFGCTGLAIEPPYEGCEHFHRGIDLAAAYGSPVRAVLGGTARVVLDVTGYGIHVLLAHPDGLVTLYAHLSAVDVVDGQVVEAGTVIGREGSSGNSTGAHLHFEVRRDGQPVSPRQAFPGLFGPGSDNGTWVAPGPTRGRIQ